METTEMQTIRAYVETFFRQSGAHGFDHILRVTRLCEEIGKAEGADMRVLIPAALFHDIARPIEEETGIPHEEEGARIAEDYLRKAGYDADKLDARGAVGIARTFMQAGEHGDGFEGAVGHIHDKLLKLRGLMYTNTAREIAERRHALLQEFVDRLEEEIGYGLTAPAEPRVPPGRVPSSPRT